jgi:indole-3-glycerol phosphate synthase
LKSTLNTLDRTAYSAGSHRCDESGILKREDVKLMRKHEVHALLVGETLCIPDCGADLAKVFSL